MRDHSAMSSCLGLQFLRIFVPFLVLLLCLSPLSLARPNSQEYSEVDSEKPSLTENSIRRIMQLVTFGTGIDIPPINLVRENTPKRGRIGLYSYRTRPDYQIGSEFLGKRAILDKKMGSEFLGKRMGSEFLGKRMGSEFLGKRMRSDFPRKQDTSDANAEAGLSQKRMGSEFLGKRMGSEFLGKRMSSKFLVKQDDQEKSSSSELLDKRMGSEFLGKRMGSEFLGKRLEPTSERTNMHSQEYLFRFPEDMEAMIDSSRTGATNFIEQDVQHKMPASEYTERKKRSSSWQKQQ